MALAAGWRGIGGEDREGAEKPSSGDAYYDENGGGEVVCVGVLSRGRRGEGALPSPGVSVETRHGRSVRFRRSDLVLVLCHLRGRVGESESARFSRENANIEELNPLQFYGLRRRLLIF